MNRHTEATPEQRMAVDWAAGTLAAHGATLHPVAGRFAWDVEMPDGSWRAVNNVSELCAAARATLEGGDK